MTKNSSPNNWQVLRSIYSYSKKNTSWKKIPNTLAISKNDIISCCTLKIWTKKKRGHIGGSRITMTHLSHSSHNLGFRSMKRSNFLPLQLEIFFDIVDPILHVFFSTVDFTKSVKKHQKKENGRNEAASSSALISKNKNWSLQGPQRPRPKARSYSSGSPQNHFQFGGGADFLRYLFNKRST